MQLIYAYGSREALPERETRCEMASELLHQVASNAAVEALLADPRVAETQAHTGRWGAMPDLRLIQGARPDGDCVSFQLVLMCACCTALCMRQVLVRFW